jgi:hypothetical protein
MYLVIFLDSDSYEFHASLHSSFATAESAFEARLREFVIPPGADLPPNKATWHALCDRCGEGVRIYRIECDGEPAEEIFLGSSKNQAA